MNNLTPTKELESRASPDEDWQQLCAITEDLLRELHADRGAPPAVTAGSDLERDLGLDSLARMELLLRIERVFGVALPEDTLQAAQVMRDLNQALRRSGSTRPETHVTRAQALLRDPVPSATGSTEGDALTVALREARTLIEVLDAHCRAHAEQVQHVVLEGGADTTVSYGQLRAAAGRVTAGLQALGVAPRQTVAIMLPTGADYFSVFWGILLAGAIPVPIYPPARASQLEDHVTRHAGILANARAVALVSTNATQRVARLLQARTPGLQRVIAAADLVNHTGIARPPMVRGDDVAFVQYTSGSTGQPKGVVLTHANLLANIRAMAAVTKVSANDVFVSWLPLYHDMGLIGAWLGPLYVGFPLVVMSPLAFLSRPVRWLREIHRWRGTISAGPNFAYELCIRRVEDRDLSGIDLSSWRLAFNGAEAVSPETVRRFSERFAGCGLRAEALTPVYGLAESSVGLLFPSAPRVAPIDSIRRDLFVREHQAARAGPNESDPLRFVACGQPLPGHEVRIVDRQGNELADRIEGRLEFRGPSATGGYLNNPEQTARLIHDGWIDTGDLAYRAEGDIYITGRTKDIVIRGGRNLYPQEIEEAVGKVAGVRKGCVAVFGSSDPRTGTERLVVMAETRAQDQSARASLQDEVVRAVLAAIGEPPDVVVLAAPQAVLKTSSGKIRRSACKERFESGLASRAPADARLQLARLLLLAGKVRLASAPKAFASRLAGLRIGAALVLLAPVAWVSVVLSGSPSAAWKRLSRIARAWLRVSGLPLEVTNRSPVPAGPCVFVSNHSSYSDGVMLLAALPRHAAFVAKRELAEQWVAGPLLRALDVLFVERFEARRSVADAEQMLEALRQGQSLTVFPEGTFLNQQGLLPFHLGAFLAAARARVPVIPVTIAGTRDLLPAGARWFRPASIAVTIGAPIEPTVDDAALPGDRSPQAGGLFAEAVRLRDAARRSIEGDLEAQRRNTG